MSRAMLFGGLLALVTGAASAADILPPAPSLDSAHLRGRFELEAGAYVRADASFGWLRGHHPASTFTSDVSSFRLDATRFERVPITGLGVGYQINGFLRADLTVEQRGSARYQGSASYVDGANCVGARCGCCSACKHVVACARVESCPAKCFGSQRWRGVDTVNEGA